MRSTLPQHAKPVVDNQSKETSWSSFEQIKQILHLLGDYVWIHDIEHEQTRFSTAYNHFIGYSPDEMPQEKIVSLWWENTDPAHRHLLMENDHKYKNGLQDHHAVEYRIRDRKGKWRWVLEKGMVTERYPNGKPRIVMGTHVDITELKEIRQRLQENEHTRKREIVDAIIRNMEADRGVMAHELHNNVNQILAAARMMLELIPMVNEEMGGYTEKVKYIIYNAVDEVNRICNLINPNTLDQVSLPELMKDQLEKASRDSKVKISLDVNGFQKGKKYPRESELTLLRVVQDAIYRISKYSKASHADIVLKTEQGFMLLDIFFDDPKFDIIRTCRNLRVVNLINRCEHYGGTYHVEKIKGKGIRLKAAVRTNGHN